MWVLSPSRLRVARKAISGQKDGPLPIILSRLCGGRFGFRLTPAGDQGGRSVQSSTRYSNMGVIVSSNCPRVRARVDSRESYEGVLLPSCNRRITRERELPPGRLRIPCTSAFAMATEHPLRGRSVRNVRNAARRMLSQASASSSSSSRSRPYRPSSSSWSSSKSSPSVLLCDAS